MTTFGKGSGMETQTENRYFLGPVESADRIRALEHHLRELYESVQEMRMHGDSKVKHVDGPTRAVLEDVEAILGVR